MAITFLNRERGPMESKRISVSKKRQITIPKKFYEQLNIQDEVECILKDGALVILPVRKETEFAEEILKDLIDQGLSGQELLEEFKKTRTRIRPAVKLMIEEAKEAAKNLRGTGDDEMREIFGDNVED